MTRVDFVHMNTSMVKVGRGGWEQLENQRIRSTAGSFDKGCQCWHQLRRRASDGGPNESRQCRAHAQRARVRYGTWPDKSDRVLADSLELLASLRPSGSLTPLLNLEMLYAARCMYIYITSQDDSELYVLRTEYMQYFLNCPRPTQVHQLSPPQSRSSSISSEY
ncbi:hypothetical protein MHUMG1_06812 [Metarhizium humberi]|uniref:Uncharacterized protein n=1 Tax=Metarhizium humberi TaxID=2596975 RepID=A0A9P8M7P2_9HYPO|nr:hypothetical protein MHUMG1_06812 [Metarhizium humberi]